MPYNKFLVPVSALLAGLIPAKLQATPAVPGDLIPSELVQERDPSTPTPNDTVLMNLQYMLKTELHSLILRQSQTGTLYAGHGSHMSHSSHASHSSHRSGY